MSGFEKTMGAMDPGSTRRTYGLAYWDGASWFADVGGNLLSCRWADPIQPYQGAPIVVDLTSDGRGQSSAFVSAMYTDQPRPTTGTVTAILPAGPAVRVVFTGEDGKSYTTDQFSGSYNIGDPVYLTWAAGKPMVLGTIQTITPPAAAPQPEAPTAQQAGYEVLAATASDTYWGPGGWGSYATSQRGGEDVYSGTWSGRTVTGAWFYGAARPVLAGKTITKILFRVPARLAAGASGAATINLWAHTSGARPGGDVTRTVGPFPVTIPAGYNPGMVIEAGSPNGYVSLPLSFAPALVAGGGISIAGEPYAGFKSRLADPESGKLILDWLV